MRAQISESSIFITGAARFRDLIYLIAKDRGLEAREVAHSRFIGFDQGEFGHMGDRNWSAVAICVAQRPAEKMVAIGEDGDVFTYVGGQTADEVIQPRPIALRGVGVVDGFAVACGMKRQVYRRVGEGSWTAMHAPVPGPDENAGFEDICGFGPNEMYAVGWEGEIWQWDGTRWINRESPTNLILTGVCCAADEQVYICGQNGVLIRGRSESWELLVFEGMSEDLWDVCWYRDKLYAASMNMVFTVAEGRLEPIDFGSVEARSFGRLTTAEGVLWSVGSSDVLAFNGETWTRLD
jgi:hypothetical protein